MSSKMAKGLYKVAISQGARPGDWWGTFESVPVQSGYLFSSTKVASGTDFRQRTSKHDMRVAAQQHLRAYPVAAAASSVSIAALVEIDWPTGPPADEGQFPNSLAPTPSGHRLFTSRILY